MAEEIKHIQANAIEFKIPIKNTFSTIDSLNKFGISDFTIDEKTKEIKLLNFDLENTQEFEVNIEKFIDNLIKNDNYDTKRKKETNAIESRYFERKDRLNLYKTWLRTFNLGKQERLRSLLSKAKKEVEIYRKNKK